MINQSSPVSKMWNQTVYAKFAGQVDPFKDRQFFRPLDRAYTGDNTFWETPSPEPPLSSEFWETVKNHLDDDRVKKAAICLAREISIYEPDPKRLIFPAILRAGTPVADWLVRLLPGSVAVSVSLFAGLGIDKTALSRIKSEYPNRKIVFVDGWTGRGGVAREIKKTGLGPLAVLIDPWNWADFSGIREDIFCPSACFTGVATQGFSRTFFTGENELFAAYSFSEKYWRKDVVKAWQATCPKPEAAVKPETKTDTQCKDHFDTIAQKPKESFYKQTELRIHANEVCRALINADPEELYFFHDKDFVSRNFKLLLLLAEQRMVKVNYGDLRLAELKTFVACSLRIKKN